MAPWQELHDKIEGEVIWDKLHQMLYATDASVYKSRPKAVALPRSHEDLVQIVAFCETHDISIIPRSAGTSLAGQVVGSGLVVDVSRYMTQVLEINEEEKWVRLQPGVIRDELNMLLAPLGLWFSPNTSTSNRCMIGGMVGNNSCGSTSIKYGQTRDKVLSLKCVLSDASTVTFFDRKSEEFKEADLCEIEKQMLSFLSDPSFRDQINASFPKPQIKRRNTGYAIDIISNMQPYDPSGSAWNMAKLLAGSEGTLALMSEIKLQLDDLPPPHVRLVTVESPTINHALLCVQQVMKLAPYQCELMDDTILKCTQDHPTYGKYLKLFPSIPRGLVMTELRGETEDIVEEEVVQLKSLLEKAGLEGRISVFEGEMIEQIWTLRKAGLGLLANLPGDAKAVACIEDTAVALEDLPEYIQEFEEMMQGFGQKSIYYAHAGAGEIHLRPVLDLKKSEDVQSFYDISLASAKLVKKYGGSLSGEHGDGRVRAPFLKTVLGEEMVEAFKEVKKLWDPKGRFNPQKIVDTPSMTEDLRYVADEVVAPPKTLMRFKEGDILRAAEKCNGSGDCRKTEKSGGGMCPSYHATREEKHTTRGRANVLREMLSETGNTKVFDAPEVKEVLDLCLSCKACAGECPSLVNMASMKSSFLHEYYKIHRRPIRDTVFIKGLHPPAFLSGLIKLGTKVVNSPLANWAKPILGFHKDRPLPAPGPAWKQQVENSDLFNHDDDVQVLLYSDEFITAFDADLLKKAKKVLSALGITSAISIPLDSARAEISKGFLDEAKRKMEDQVDYLWKACKKGIQIVGLEPSTILGLRDEMPRLVGQAWVEKAVFIASHVSTFSEFLEREMQDKEVTFDQFKQSEVTLHVHAHCHFKALGKESALYFSLGHFPGAKVNRIPSGCCGMAGSFGYEKEHFEVSKKIAELVLLPYIEKVSSKEVIIAHGTSCRHQIQDFAQRSAIHPVEWMYSRIKEDENED